MDFFERPHYRLNKRLLFYVGQWPLQTPKERIFYRTTTVLLVGSITLPELIKFAECLGDLKAMIECLPIMFLNLMSIVKFINSCIQATKMRKLINRIKDDWTGRTGEYDEDILRFYADRGRQLTVAYTIFMFTGMALYLSIPLIPIILDVVAPLNQSRNQVILFQTEYFVNQEDNYFYIMIHSYITMPLSIGILIAYDTMFAVYVQHACSIFATASARLQSIGGIANDKKLEIYKDEPYDDIIACIKIHNEAVEITKLIESSNSFSFLFMVGATMLMTTISGFMTVTNVDHPSEALRYIVVVSGDFIHLLYLCWQGQVLMEHSEDMFINAYNVKWYDISPRARKLLVLIMCRSLEPCKLTAGKIFDLTMKNYAAAMKTSMSYFTVLLSVQ